MTPIDRFGRSLERFIQLESLAGVMLYAGGIILAGFARLPSGVNWTQLFGVSVLCGVGFTMSLFVGDLAFAEGGSGYARIDRLGILFGSGLSAVVGFLILKLSIRAKPAPRSSVAGRVDE